MNDHPLRPLVTAPRRRGLALSLLLALCAVAALRCDTCEVDAGAVTMTADGTPVCSAEQDSRWQFVHDQQLGAAGRDPVGEVIGTFTADGKYRPIDVVKQTLCGRLHHFNFYDDFGSGDEADWNNFMIPSPAFAFILDDARSGANASQIHDCDGDGDCLEAEITPDEHYYNGPWFPKSSGVSPLEGSTLCTYGPWVGDGGHGNRPEIHPSELFWFRSSANVLRLMVVQEDSNRFDSRGDYNVPSTPPAGWRPWSAFPRSGEFQVAFEVRPGSTKRTLLISEEAERNVVTADDPVASADVTDGVLHQIKYDGAIVLSVTEGLSDTRRLGVQFSQVCRSAGNDRLRGFVVLTTKVGKGDDGDEGYHVLAVDDRETMTAEPPVRPPRVTVDVAVTAGTLSRPDCKIPRLAIDATATLTGSSEATADDLAVSAVELVQVGGREPVKFQAAAPAGGAVEVKLSSLPLQAGGTLAITLRSGLVLSTEIPAPVLAPLRSDAYMVGAADAAAWKSLLAISGATGSPALPVDLQRLASASVALSPAYAPARDGAASPDDESAIAEELNELIVKGETKRLQDLFCAAQPFQISWTFEAKNLTSGRPGNVRQDVAGKPEEFLYSLNAGAFPDSALRVLLPSAPVGEVGQLIAHARVSDGIGQATVDVEFDTHQLSFGDADKLTELLLPALGTAVAVDPAALVAASALAPADGKGTLATDAASRRARVLRLATQSAAEDKRIALSELRALVASAKRYAGK